ncbi:hypothetical protein [Frankia canadensis]|uniref:hypothetical protein n=1 Tax=Frankia canadensis TaxID=1836972 RepID=UPI001FAF5AA5|nr:hypothetical protein [Frankia canadensis]
MSLAFFTLGAVLTFAVDAHPSGLDISAVGVILMLVSLVGLGITLYQNQWRRKIVEESVESGVPSPVSVDGTVIVDPGMHYEAPRRQEPGLTPDEDLKANGVRHPEFEQQEVVHVSETQRRPASRS